MTREERRTKEDNWKYRRLAFFSQQALFGGLLAYVTIVAENENTIHLMLVQALPLAMVGSLMAYIGGPIADDWLQLRVSKS